MIDGPSTAVILKPLAWVAGILVGFIVTLFGYIWHGHKKEVDAIHNKLDNHYYPKEIIDLKLEKLEEAVEDNTASNKELISSVNKLNLTLARMNGISQHRPD